MYEGPSRIETKSVTLDCGHYHGGMYNLCEAQEFNLCTLGAVQRGLSFHLSMVKMYVYSRYLLGSRLVFAEYLRQVLQAGRSVLSFPSAVGE